MKFKGIAKKWFLNSFLIMFAVILILVCVATGAIHTYYYNGISQVIYGNAVGVSSYFSDYSTTQEFESIARSYVQSFPNKEIMQVSIYDHNDNCIVTSTGFNSDSFSNSPDVIAAKTSEDCSGEWIGDLSTGEHIMAISKAVYNPYGDYMGLVRYVVSLERADRAVAILVSIIAIAGIGIMVIFLISNIYFIKSITKPLEQINLAAKKIATGDFSTRIATPSDDEVGELCDTINYMVSELDNGEKMKNDFISSISHEIRTPLTAIKGWAETMKMSDEVDTKTINKGMNIIVNETERLSGIVEELLDFSRMQNKSMVFMLEKIDLLAELDEAIYMFKEQATAEHKHLVFEEPEILSPVMADKNRMKQVFINTIDNALKYTEETGTINISVKEDETNVYVIISDNGCGISKDDLPRIKDKFYKANNEKRGSGIGLAVANEIMLLHSGSLRIESEKGKGTTVIITIPHIKPE